MENPGELAARIQRLEDIEEIKQLKHRYWRCLDLKRWDELRQCFTPDATVDYGEGRYRFSGVDAIMDFLTRSLGRETGAMGVHHGGHPEIELTGPTTAHGSWSLWNYLFNPQHKRGVWIGSYYSDQYVKVAGGWRIRHTGYVYLFHEEWSRDDLPSLRVVAPA